MFEFSTSEIGLVKYWYDEQLAVILAFLVRSLVSENATLATVQQTRHVSRSQRKFSFTLSALSLNAVSRKSPGSLSHYTAPLLGGRQCSRKLLGYPYARLPHSRNARDAGDHDTFKFASVSQCLNTKNIEARLPH